VSEARIQDRRSFLKEAALAGMSGSLMAACVRAGPSPAIKPSVQNIGVQVYTVRDLMQKDFEGTLEQIARIGYTQIEFAGYYDRTPEQVRATLDRLRLTSPSAHIGVNLLRQDIQGQITSAKTIGQRYVTVPSYPFPRDAGKQAFVDAAAELSKWGEACRARGVRLAYHNHAGELRDVGGGTTGLDVMLQETQPGLVEFENDLYWTTFAGVDPRTLFAKYPGRFTLWHVKDMRDPQGTKGMAPVGEGTIDYRAIFAEAGKAGLRHFFVEHDTAAQYEGGSLASLARSYATLKQILS
jgi:sugar phosphate isomerase/epimerase